MLGTSLSLFADLGACHVQKSSVTICVLPAPFRWRATGTGMSMQTAVQISIHALRVKGDLNISDLQMSYITFLSTPSGWRATRLYAVQRLAVENFYPRPPGGGRQSVGFAKVLFLNYFYPRPPGRGRPARRGRGEREQTRISIHALRVEGDSYMSRICCAIGDFYPRPPGGGRLFSPSCIAKAPRFLSTPSGWRAIPLFSVEDRLRMHFYPRPPGGGRREAWRKFCCSSPNFYPRPPDGGRSHFSPWKIGYECISIHALWVEGDVLKAVIRITVCISIHALRVEGDPAIAKGRCSRSISIHALRVEGDMLVARKM